MLPYDLLDSPFPLIRRIVAWHSAFDDTLDAVVSDTGPDEAWKEAHDREALAIGRELKKILKPSIPVFVKQMPGWKIIDEK